MARTEVLVVGGGATGTGTARDLAMRGFDVTLVERGPLSAGTTGRMHGLLHSGARYAVADPTSARHCLRENRILRDVAPACVEPTGGLFVKRPDDSAAYFERKVERCRACDIPVEVLDGDGAREIEPSLAADVERAFRVPDAAIDSVRLCVANAVDAEAHGARVETHAEVTDLLVSGDEVRGAEVRRARDSGAAAGNGAPDPPERTGRRTERIEAEHVVNATGAWAGRVAELAGVNLTMRPTKGAMVVSAFDRVGTVLNRCRPRSEGDILVPRESTAVLGTTDEPVDDPEAFAREQRAVDLLVAELAKLVPGLADAPTVDSFWGVRPLYEPGGSDAADPGGSDATDPAAVDRDFFVLDHETRDGIGGLTSVVGGKVTTYRLMAERVSDHVCEVLGTGGRCRTDELPLPGREAAAELDEFATALGVHPADPARWDD